ncbi:putative F-box protein At1g32420 [Papaver somniferum]|uniref:putative F-box protein At1g32420 n=1 Tax=Papaver somniferum TaxID=3469 RepID=UPI000E6F5DB9|nr:putative F-box protein At1g32420 [Papaver somniferum]
MEDGTVGSDDILVCEILSRFPVKSLMRFKCVCKRWLQVIEDDSHFIDLHLYRSKTRPSLFYVLKDPRDWLKRKRFTGRDEFFLTADLSPEGIAYIHSIRRTNLFCYDQILGPINGLIFFVDKHKCSVCIYKIITREASPWIQSTVLLDEKEKHLELKTLGFRRPTYKFGYDPTTKEHKVLCMWSIDPGGNNFLEEINDDYYFYRG